MVAYWWPLFVAYLAPFDSDMIYMSVLTRAPFVVGHAVLSLVAGVGLGKLLQRRRPPEHL